MVVIGRYCKKMVKLGTNQKDGAVIASHRKAGWNCWEKR